MNSRIAKLSPFLQHELWNGANPAIIKLRTSSITNSTKEAHGYSAFEVWHVGSATSNESLSIDLKLIRKFVMNARKRSREAEMRNKKAGRIRLPFSFKKFKAWDTYGNELESPIKKEDNILLEGPYNKNQIHPWYKICKTVEIPEAIETHKSVHSAWVSKVVNTIRGQCAELRQL